MNMRYRNLEGETLFQALKREGLHRCGKSVLDQWSESPRKDEHGDTLTRYTFWSEHQIDCDQLNMLSNFGAFMEFIWTDEGTIYISIITRR